MKTSGIIRNHFWSKKKKEWLSLSMITAMMFCLVLLSILICECCNDISQRVALYFILLTSMIYIVCIRGSMKICDVKKETSNQVNQHVYVRNQIIEYNTIKKEIIKSRDDVNKEQESMNNVIKLHDKIINDWLVFSEQMNNEYKSCRIVMEDDKNKSSTLLSSYYKCKTKWQQQQIRMESVSDAVSYLTKQSDILKNCCTKHEENIPNAFKTCTDAESKYNETVQRREKTENSLQTLLKQLNVLCDEENMLNKQKCDAFDLHNQLQFELKVYTSMLCECNDIMKQYITFDEENDENITEMKVYFNNKWQYVIKHWYEWDVFSIVCWIKYLIEKGELMLSGDINFDKISKQMEQSKIDGESLKTMDKSDLKSIGFEILSDRQRIYNKMQQIILKYPMKVNGINEGELEGADNDDNTLVHEIKIPKEFICPLSKNVMNNPVQIFDGYTYEKSDIESYLNKHKKSPMTHKICNDIWYLPNRKLKQKIDTFLSVNTAQ
eukprot:391885_1